MKNNSVFTVLANVRRQQGLSLTFEAVASKITSTRSQVNKIKYVAGPRNMASKSSMSSATSVLQVQGPKNSRQLNGMLDEW